MLIVDLYAFAACNDRRKTSEPDLVVSISVVFGVQLSDDDSHNVDQKQSIHLAQQKPAATHATHAVMFYLQYHRYMQSTKECTSTDSASQLVPNSSQTSGLGLNYGPV